MDSKKGIFSVTPEEFIKRDEELTKELEERAKAKENNFPVEVFPPVIRNIIKATHQNLNYPVDFTGASILYAASVAIGNTVKIEVKKTFQETAVLYLAIVARAGANKSHPLSFAMQPLMDHDEKTYLEYEKQRQQYEQAFNLSKKERDKQNDEEPVKPVWHKLLVSDFTPEALIEVHRYNKRGIGVYIDELAGWFKNFNRYNSGSEMEFWISQWSGKRLTIDRKTTETAYITRPFISVAGTIQNALLKDMARDSRSKNGFMDRILFVIPDNLQKPYWNDSEINPDLVTDWNTIIENLLKQPLQLNDKLNPEPLIMHLTPEAKNLLITWQNKNADACNDEDNDAIAGIYSKLEIYAARLALILEMLDYACGNDDVNCITARSVQGALKLVEYFKNSAVKVHEVLNNTNPLLSYSQLKQSVYHALPQSFTTETGQLIAQNHNMHERTFRRFLHNTDLFTCINYGEYEKCI
jgi:uncharacterized cupredoxin-like copper-binding protein